MSGHDSVHCRRHYSQRGERERGITWSKCTRTRRCQSLRKSRKVSVNAHFVLWILVVVSRLTVVLDLLVVLDRLRD